MKKVLIVAHDETNRLVARVLFERRDCRVIEAECGLKAINLVKNEAVDLVLVDLDMPGMDGFKTTRLMRDENFHPKLPIVVLTENIGKEVIALCVEAGAISMIEKPLKPEQLDRLMSLLDLNILVSNA